MKESLSPHEQAIEHVHKVENEHMEWLLEWEQDASIRAEKCGCPNCQKEKQSVTWRVAMEVHRLAKPRGMNSDERALMNYALSRISRD